MYGTKGSSLFRINPLSVNLDSLKSAFINVLLDVKTISNTESETDLGCFYLQENRIFQKYYFYNVLLDVKTISNNGILSDDIPYNTIYYPKRKKLYIVDTDDYSFSDMDST